jgi:hypothetical protein
LRIGVSADTILRARSRYKREGGEGKKEKLVGRGLAFKYSIASRRLGEVEGIVKGEVKVGWN